jgi:predicted DCC family thiol-disulfide oxidoreductase YuxK
MAATHQIILFDGVCNLCNGAVQFIIKRDAKDIFRFASLQSETGQKLLATHQLQHKNIDSIVLVKNNNAYIKSTAALHIAKELSGIWKLAYYYIFIPKFIRDAVYDFVARNRYRWFGKKDQCMVPTAQLKSRFLD